MKKNSQSGFTLIELLVVIAIIGILASVVLASLNSARTKGADAAVKANLANARAQAELFYDTGNTYTLVCTSGTANGIYPLVSAAAVAAGAPTTGVVTVNGAAQTTATANCNTNGTDWAASVKLKSGSLYYCVDSTGAAKETTLLPTTTYKCV